MSIAGTKAVAPDAPEELVVADGGGDEHFDTDGRAPRTDTPSDSSNANAGGADGDGDDSADAAANDGATPPRRWRTRGAHILAYIVLPAVALLLALAAGYLKWVDGSARLAQVARSESVQAAIDSTVAMLSYRPDTVEQNLAAAPDRMTGPFRDSYLSLTHDVVITGAKQRQISAVATLPAAASVSATATHAVVLVFVDQTTIIGNDPPSDSTSSIKVTLEKVHDRWLISQFDPV
jgi:Mce-associated membrane protein